MHKLRISKVNSTSAVYGRLREPAPDRWSKRPPDHDPFCNFEEALQLAIQRSGRATSSPDGGNAVFSWRVIRSSQSLKEKAGQCVLGVRIGRPFNKGGENVRKSAALPGGLGGCCHPILCKRLRNERLRQFAIHWPGNMIPLPILTFQRLELGQLLRRFDALRDHIHAQIVGERHNRLHNL